MRAQLFAEVVEFAKGTFCCNYDLDSVVGARVKGAVYSSWETRRAIPREWHSTVFWTVASRPTRTRRRRHTRVRSSVEEAFSFVLAHVAVSKCVLLPGAGGWFTVRKRLGLKRRR